METFNEFVTLLALYMILCYTDFVPIPDDRDFIGSSQNILIICFVAVHLSIMLLGSLKGSYTYLKTIFINRRNRQEMERREEEAFQEADRRNPLPILIDSQRPTSSECKYLISHI